MQDTSKALFRLFPLLFILLHGVSANGTIRRCFELEARLSPQHSLKANERQPSGALSWRSENGNPISPPIGMAREDFDSVVNTIRTSHDFTKIGAVIIGGSRTHFSYGYGPGPKSDLDIGVLCVHSPPRCERMKRISEQVGITDRLVASLKPLSDNVGIRIKGDLVSTFDIQQAFDKRNLRHYLGSGKPPDEARSIWNALSAEGLRSGWSKVELRRSYEAALGGRFYIHREALILIRESPEAPSLVRKFRALGYPNIILVSGGTTGQ